MTALGDFSPGDVLTAADMNAIGTWTSYTPTWNGSSAAPSIGNGTLTGRYTQIGNVVIYVVRMTAGSTTTFGSGRYDFSLPVAPTNATAFITTFGSAMLADASTANAESATVVAMSGSYATFRRTGGGFGDVTSSLPWTWASGDSISFVATYEVA